jgi:nucleoside-triphosphatase
VNIKIFLTGDAGVGKSTILHRLIKSEAIIAAGFKTFCVGKNVFISKFNSDKEKYVVGIRDISINKPIGFTEKFDNYGVKILDESLKIINNIDLFIMDEIGIMEEDAKKFQRKIIEILNMDLNVLGVIKNKKNKFLDKIKENNEIKIINVTTKNREKIFYNIKQEFKFVR